MIRPSTKFTYREYVHFEQVRERIELLEGEKIVTPAPSTYHQAIVRNLMALFLDILRSKGSATGLFCAPTDVILNPVNVVQPDLLYVRDAGIIEEHGVVGAPDLVIEIVSPTTHERDFVTKRLIYQNFGVNEYWIVQPSVREVTVHVLGATGYETSTTYSETAMIPIAAIGNVEIPCNLIFDIG